MIDYAADPIAISPAEPAELQTIGIISSFPETIGLDFCWSTANGIAGVQRKQFPEDFLSSLYDGRLTKEIMQISCAVAFPLLILEGTGQGWTSDGRLIHRHAKFTRAQLQGFLLSLQIAHGIPWLQVGNIRETGPVVVAFREWTLKDSHRSLMQRPGPGDHRTRPWQEHFLQGLPAVGPKTAAAIIDHFGRIPFIPPSVDDLCAVPGVGRKKAQAIVAMFRESA